MHPYYEQVAAEFLDSVDELLMGLTIHPSNKVVIDSSALYVLQRDMPNEWSGKHMLEETGLQQRIAKRLKNRLKGNPNILISKESIAAEKVREKTLREIAKRISLRKKRAERPTLERSYLSEFDNQTLSVKKMKSYAQNLKIWASERNELARSISPLEEQLTLRAPVIEKIEERIRKRYFMTKRTFIPRAYGDVVSTLAKTIALTTDPQTEVYLLTRDMPMLKINRGIARYNDQMMPGSTDPSRIHVVKLNYTNHYRKLEWESPQLASAKAVEELEEVVAN